MKTTKYILTITLINFIFTIYGQNNFQKQLDAKIQSLVEPLNLKSGGAIGIISKDSIIYTKSYGYRNYKEKLPFDINSPFYIASTSKVFIAVLAIKMANEGKLNLNQSLNHYMPELKMGLKYNEKDITVLDLLTHTHGFRNSPLIRMGLSTGLENHKNIVQMLNEKSYALDNRNFRYGNLGTNIVAAIIEKQTGESWKELVNKYIFQPLEMNNSSCYISDYNDIEFVKAVDSRTGETYLDKKDNSMQPAGGIISTINDMLKFLSVFTNNGNYKGKQYLTDKNLKLMTSIQRKQDRMFGDAHRIGYGVGWDLVKYNDETILTRHGVFQGLVTTTTVSPKHNLALVSFDNDRNFSLAFDFPELALNEMLNKTNKEEYLNKRVKAATRGRKRLDSMVVQPREFPMKYPDKLYKVIGTYTNKTWGEISFAESNDTLYVHRGNLKGPIRTWDYQGRTYYYLLSPKLRYGRRIFELTKPLGMEEGVYMHWDVDTLYFKKETFKPYSNEHWKNTFNNNVEALYTQYDKYAKIITKNEVLEKEKNRRDYYIDLKNRYGEISKYNLLTSEKEQGGYTYKINSLETLNGNELLQLYITKDKDGFTQRVIELNFEKGKTDKRQLKAVSKARKKWINICNSHKPNELVKTMYHNNAKYYNKGRLLVSHKQLIDEYKYMSNPKYSLNLIPIHVIPVNKDIVYEIGQCSGSYKGKYVLVWKKDEKGNWKVIFDSNN